MSITLHCSYCGKKIEAQDSTGGKWGKCPACHNKVYVPALTAVYDDELKFAPVDEDEARKEKELMAETFELTQDILKERDDSPAGSVKIPSFKVSDEDLTENIILYLSQMADSLLEEANDTVKAIKPHSAQAVEIIDRIAISDMPEPELANIPPHVLAGLIRALRAAIA